MKDDYIQEEDDGLLHIIEQEREKIKEEQHK